MNIQLARTFLEVLEAGNLNKAAERLNVTQSTVTMRINTLEEQLGRRLLVRSKSGVGLTNAGFKFRRYAEMLVRIWHQAQQEIALPEPFEGTLNIGYEVDFWDGGVDDWLAWFASERPEIALQVWAGDGEALNRWLASGLIDCAVTFGDALKGEFKSEPLFSDRLVLVSREKRPLRDWDPGYIYVDWGETFRRNHALAYPASETSPISFGDGAFALQHILARGGSGHLPLRSVRGHLDAGRLHLVPQAPEFARPAFLARSPYMASDVAKAGWFEAAVAVLKTLGDRFADLDLETRPFPGA
jgi:DNA-binding transcriptional LysR family regulator